MNSVVLVCFIVAAVAVLAGFALVGRQAYLLYRTMQEVGRQMAPHFEALLSVQEQAMNMAARIGQRQQELAVRMAAARESLGRLVALLGSWREAQRRLTSLNIS